jgi:hypothetical protein
MGTKNGKETKTMWGGYWWIEGLLGVALVVAPFVGKFTMLHREAYTDVIAGVLLVVWALVGYWFMGGMQSRGGRPTHA